MLHLCPVEVFCAYDSHRGINIHVAVNLVKHYYMYFDSVELASLVRPALDVSLVVLRVLCFCVCGRDLC